MFNGSIVSLITPFSNDGLDEKALARLVHFHLENGTHAILPAGTTGEAPTLNKSDYKRLLEIVVEEVSGKVPVIAGAGSYNPVDAISNTKLAEEVGVDAVLHVMGYYNRPNQEGIYQHFKVLNDATNLPIIVYNIPPRAVIDILPETMTRVATLTNVVGVKDSTCDLSRPLKERLLIKGDFCFLTGEDQTVVSYNANGGQGCISVTANVAPRLCAELQNACSDQNFQLAREIQLKLMPLHQALFIEPSPAGVKYASSLLGLNNAYCRLPIVELAPETKKTIEKAMKQLELI